MKNRLKLLSIVVLTSLTAFTMIACKSADEKTKDNLQGKWKWTLAGEWIQIEFSGDNYTLTDSYGSTPEKGTFSVSGDKLIFTSEGESETYSFSLDGGDKLTITFNKDYILTFIKQ